MEEPQIQEEQMPQTEQPVSGGDDYISKSYNALKAKVQGFSKTPEEFKNLITTDTKYRSNVYNAFKQKVGGFSKTPEEFDNLILPKQQIKEEPFDPIETSLKAKQDEQAVTSSTDLEGGLVTMPDEAKRKQALLDRQKIKDAGFDADELDAAFKDFPKELFETQQFSKENLLKLRKDNPVKFQRTVATAKWQAPLYGAIAEQAKVDPNAVNDIANIRNAQNAEKKDYDSTRQHTRDAVNAINKYIQDPEERKKMIGYLGKDVSTAYGVGVKGQEDALKNDPRSKYLNKNELLGLQYTEDLDPESASTYNNILVDEDKLQKVPVTHEDGTVTDEVEGKTKLGLQQQKAKLAQVGIGLKMQNASQEMDDIVAKQKGGKQLSEKEIEKYNESKKEYDSAAADAKDLVNPKSKEYGKFADHNLDGIAQELFGQRHGFVANQGLKFQSGIGNTLSSGGNLIADLFRDENEQKGANLHSIGQDIQDKKDTYTTQENALWKNFDVTETPEFTEAKNKIINNPDLSDQQKLEQGKKLLAENKGWEMKPIGSQFHPTLKSVGYALGDTANGLAQFMLTNTALGGAGNVSKLKSAAQVFASTFLQDYQRNVASNMENNEENPKAKALLSSAISGALFAGVDKVGIIKKMFNPETPIGKAVENMTDAELDNLVKKSGTGIIKNIVDAAATSFKHSLPMTAAGTASSIAHDAINGNLKDAEEYLKEGLTQQALFTLLGTPMGAKNKGAENKESGELANNEIENRNKLDEPTELKSTTVQMPEDVAATQKKTTTTKPQEDYKPETKKSSVSVILPKTEINEQQSGTGSEPTGQGGTKKNNGIDGDRPSDNEGNNKKDSIGAEQAIPETANDKGQIRETNIEAENVKITHSALAKTRKALGLPEYKGKEVEPHEQLLETAKELIKGGYDLKHIYDKVKNGDPTTNVENAIMAEYKAALDIELEKNPTKANLKKAKEFADINDVAGTLLGKGLESRKIVKSLAEAENLSNFLVSRQKDKGHELSEPQIKTESEKFIELKKAKDELEAALNVEQEKNAALVAEHGLQKARQIKKKDVKKSHEDYVAERKNSVDKAKEALAKLKKSSGNELSSVALPFAKEAAEKLAAIAPHVKDYVKSLVNEGIDKLDDIATHVHNEFKNIVEGLTKKDAIDLIGGLHDEKKETRNEKAVKLRLIKREAELLNELDLARKGEEKANNERSKSAKTRRIEELETKIKEVRDLNKEKALADEDVQEKSDTQKSAKTDADRNIERQSFLKNQISKLETDIANKNYAIEEKQIKPFKLTKQTEALQDRVIELQNKITAQRYADQRAKMGKWEKRWDKFQNIAGISRLVQTAIDASIWFRQLGSLALNPRKWDIAAKFISAGAKSIFSTKNYDRVMDGIHKSSDFKETLEDGIKYNELGAVDPKSANEMFPQSFIMQIPILREGLLGNATQPVNKVLKFTTGLVREPLKASQRIADASINIARYELYQKYKKNLLDEGVTRESDPEQYKAMAKWVMNSTGSGNLIGAFEGHHKAEKALGATFYGARLMAANFNTLNPVYYAKMIKDHPQVAKAALKDIASYTTTMMVTALGLAAAGGEISLDPDKSDFLQIRFGNKVYDITGGKASYIRTFLRLVEAGYARSFKSKYEANKATEFAAKSTLSFFRNKLAPNTSYIVDAFAGKNSIGKDFNPEDILKVYPMYADDAYKAAKEDGYTSLLTVLLPNIIGIGYGAYYSDPQRKGVDETIERNTHSDEIDFSKIKNRKEGDRSLSEKEKTDYAKARDIEIEKGIRALYDKGVPVLDNGNVVIKKYSEFTKDQIIAETNRVKAIATKKVKEEMFGKDVKTRYEKISDRKLKNARKESD